MVSRSLKIADVSDGLESRLTHLRSDILGGCVQARRRGGSTLQCVGGQEGDVRLQVLGTQMSGNPLRDTLWDGLREGAGGAENADSNSTGNHASIIAPDSTLPSELNSTARPSLVAGHASARSLSGKYSYCRYSMS